ncbi:hypothetical protein KEM60_00806 [Austwickia sp. TVS 96-490-7B]|nr:hypothetical protein [Austwickia sp. TVS 96-490-7B]
MGLADEEDRRGGMPATDTATWAECVVNAAPPAVACLSHGDVHLAKLVLRAGAGLSWTSDLVGRVAARLGIGAAEMGTRLHQNMVLECMWGPAFHVQHRIPCAPTWLAFLRQRDL